MSALFSADGSGLKKSKESVSNGAKGDCARREPR